MSGNLYSSTIRRFITTGLAGQVLNPPSDLAVAAGLHTSFMYTRGPIVTAQPLINPDSNFIVHNIGLFSNFADGLVFKGACPVQLGIRAETYDPEPLLPFLTGTVSCVAGSNTINGAGTLFLTELVPNNVIVLAGFPFRIASVISDTEADIIEACPVTVTNETFVQKLNLSGADNTESIFVSTLNEMYPTTSFVHPVSLSATPASFIFLRGFFKNDFILNFLTKSIDTAYVDDINYWWVHADVEFTQKYGD